jgi:hypothetical protein
LIRNGRRPFIAARRQFQSRVLGITIPESFLLQADEVIE